MVYFDRVYFDCVYFDQVFQGFITKVEEDFILSCISKEFDYVCQKNLFDVEFTFSPSLFTRKHQALDLFMAPNALGFDFLFPDRKPEIVSKAPQLDIAMVNGNMSLLGRELPWIDYKLNDYQKEAIVNILRGECRPLPYIVYGPPGT